MKIRWMLLFAEAYFTPVTFAQSLRYPVAMPYIGIEAYSAKQNSPFSFTGNQAALATCKNIGVGIYGERKFMLKETNMYALAAVFNSKLGNIGIQANYSGFKNFNESKIGLAYGRSVGEKIDVGIQFNYYGYKIPGYGNASSVNFELGAILHFTNAFCAGIHVYNPVGGKLGKTGNEKLAAVYKLGLGYDASDDFFIGGEVIKEEDKPVNVITGLQYRFARQFFSRVGFTSESGVLFAGAGVGWSNLRLDITVSYHPQLKFSPGILIITNFKTKSP